MNKLISNRIRGFALRKRENKSLETKEIPPSRNRDGMARSISCINTIVSYLSPISGHLSSFNL